jgi:hypothetical protein
MGRDKEKESFNEMRQKEKADDKKTHTNGRKRE